MILILSTEKILEEIQKLGKEEWLYTSKNEYFYTNVFTLIDTCSTTD